MALEVGSMQAARSDLDREVLQEIEHSPFMTYELVEKWGDGIPVFPADPDFPDWKWKPTPVVQLDLSQDGFGEVYIKNEADLTSNPTGTIKDRAAWELATLYRDYARALYLKTRTGAIRKQELGSIRVPHLSLVTAGNEGRALAECFKKYDLPPPKIVVGKDTKPSITAELLKLRADIYATDLSRELRPEDIRRISNNAEGVDITSSRAIDPSSVFYDWHVHEVFNEKPDQIYVPYGSGRLMENYLTWQARSIRNDSERKYDPPLKVPVSDVISMDVFGAEPSEHLSVADKLGAPFKPFLLFADQDIKALVDLSFSGKETSKNMVGDERILNAGEILAKNGIDAEPSAAAGLALYMDRFENGLVEKGKKILIVNTGKGLV